ncbi:MAG TPA: polymer-forming cytoskeletal protein [Hyphomicrobiaceae bacterium]|jgi:cytoskeletal protein CcmA (bactofilin family)
MLPSFSNKKPEKDGAFGASGAGSSAGRVGRNGASVSIIGPDLVIIGDLVSNGQVQVDGEVQGDIHGSHIVIGEGARVTGGIVSEEVVVRGTVEGSIRGRKVMLQAESKVEGDIYHKSLAIEQGAYFEGKSRRLEDPLAGVQRPELPAEPAPAYD